MRYSITTKKVMPFLTGFFLLNNLVCQAGVEDTVAPKIYDMEEIYVTGEKVTAEESGTIRKTVINVKEKVDAGQINSVGDLLRDVAGITVQSTAGGARVAMRGLSDDRFAVAINGNIQTKMTVPGSAAYRYNLEWDTIPVSNIHKIEVIRGASSAAYFGTWGGVINIITLQKPGENHTDLKLSSGSFDTQKYSIMNQGSTADGRFSWTVNAGKHETAGYNINTWQNSEDSSANFNYQFKDQENLAFSWAHNHKEQGVENFPGKYDEWNTNDYSLKYSIDSTELRLFQNEREYLTNQMLNKVTKRYMTNQGFNWQQTVHINNHDITYGLQEQSYDFDFSPATMKTKLNGLFIQDNWQVKPDITIGLGTRYDSFTVDLDSTLNPLTNRKGNPYSGSSSQLSPKISITKAINANEEIFASASSVYRPPNVGEYFYWAYVYCEDWNSTSAAKKLANSCGITTQKEWQQTMGVLQPEKGWSYELGWRKQATNRLGWKVTGFYNSIDNYIYQSNPEAIQKGYTTNLFMRNIPHVAIKGVELSLDYAFNKRMSGTLSLTNQTATKDPDFFDSSTKLHSIPKNTLNINLKYKVGKVRTSLDTCYLGSHNGLGGFTTTDFSFAVDHKDSTTAFAIRNIFNKDYKDETGSSMPGINYSLSWQYKL